MRIEDRLRSPFTRSVIQPVAEAVTHALFGFEVKGLSYVHDLLDGRGPPFVLAANHVSWFDGFILGSIVPDVEFALAKEKCWLNAFERFFVPRLGGIPVVRSWRLEEFKSVYPEEYGKYISEKGRFDFRRYVPQGFRQEILEDIGATLPNNPSLPKTMMVSEEDLNGLLVGQSVLRKGRNLLVFPQGTRDPTQGVNGAHHGLARILFELAEWYDEAVPVIPCSIAYDSYFPYCPRRKVTVSFGQPRTVRSKMETYRRDPRAGREMFTNSVMADIKALMDGTYAPAVDFAAELR